MEKSDKKQESPPVDEFRSQLKGIIPRRLSDEEFGELIEWLKENAKNISEYVKEEYDKHVREISKPPERAQTQLNRITFNPRIFGGKAIIKGTRISVSLILNFLAAKMTPEDIIEEYPQLTIEDIQAALAYAAEVTDGEVVMDKTFIG